MMSTDLVTVTQSREEVAQIAARGAVQQPQEKGEPEAEEGVGVGIVEETREGVACIKKKLVNDSQQFQVLSGLHPWRHTLFPGGVQFHFSSFCSASVKFGPSLPEGGRGISQTRVEFANPPTQETIAGIPRQVMPQALEWIQVLVQSSRSHDLWANIETSLQLRSILPQFSSTVLRSSNLVREIYSLTLQQDLPLLIRVIQNKSGIELGGGETKGATATFPLFLEATFLRKNSPYFLIVFGLSHTYPFEKVNFRLEGLRSSDPLRSHVEEIVTSASAGESGAGCQPISSICKALARFLA